MVGIVVDVVVDVVVDGAVDVVDGFVVVVRCGQWCDGGTSAYAYACGHRPPSHHWPQA